MEVPPETCLPAPMSGSFISGPQLAVTLAPSSRQLEITLSDWNSR